MRALRVLRLPTAPSSSPSPTLCHRESDHSDAAQTSFSSACPSPQPTPHSMAHASHTLCSPSPRALPSAQPRFAAIVRQCLVLVYFRCSACARVPPCTADPESVTYDYFCPCAMKSAVLTCEPHRQRWHLPSGVCALPHFQSNNPRTRCLSPRATQDPQSNAPRTS